LSLFVGFAVHAAHFLSASGVCLPLLLALVFNLELLIPGLVGNTFDAHRLARSCETATPDIVTDKHARVVKLLRDARRQIDLAAAPGEWTTAFLSGVKVKGSSVGLIDAKRC
jgi:hypothetical protein